MQLDTVVARLDVHEYVPARLLPVPVVPFLDELAFERLEERLGDRIVERGLGLDADWAIPWDSRRPWSSWKTRLRRRAGAPARRLLDGVCCHLLDNPLRYRQSHHLARECVDYDRQVEQSIVGGHVDDMVPLIVLHKFSQPPVQLLFEQRLVQVSAGAPFAVRDVLQAGGHQHQCGFPVGARADHAGPAPDLPVEPLDGVVRADAPPMPAGHLAVRQRLGEALAHDLGGLLQLHRLELVGHRLGLCRRGLARLHGVDCLGHGRDLGALGFGDLGQRVAVEAHGAALVSGIRERLGDRAHHAGGLVAGEHAHAAQPSRLQPR